MQIPEENKPWARAGGGFIPEGRSLREGKEGREGRKVGLCLQLLTEENKGNTNTFPVGKNQCCSNRKWLQEHSKNLLEFHGMFAG